MGGSWLSRCQLGKPRSPRLVSRDHEMNLGRAFRVQIINAADGKLLVELGVPNAVEVGFSPKGTFLSTWERYGARCPSYVIAVGANIGVAVKPADETTQHKNFRIWRVETGEEVIGFPQKSQDNW